MVCGLAVRRSGFRWHLPPYKHGHATKQPLRFGSTAVWVKSIGFGCIPQNHSCPWERKRLEITFYQCYWVLRDTDLTLPLINNKNVKWHCEQCGKGFYVVESKMIKHHTVDISFLISIRKHSFQRTIVTETCQHFKKSLRGLTFREIFSAPVTNNWPLNLWSMTLCVVWKKRSCDLKGVLTCIHFH